MPPASGHDWITLHRVRFERAMDATSRTFDAPDGADCWRFCPSLVIGDDGLPTWQSDLWCGLGIYSSRAAAQTVFEAPETRLPYLTGALEQWHALLLPVAHRGEVKWRDTVQSGDAILPASDAPGGPLVVLTTAGYVSRGPDQVPRIVAFIRGIQAVLEFYGTLDGNLRREVFAGGFDGRDGFTLSLWRDDDAMQQAAYRPGVHRTLMDQSRDGSLFDRSSFTRARLVDTRGSWDGEADIRKPW